MAGWRLPGAARHGIGWTGGGGGGGEDEAEDFGLPGGSPGDSRLDPRLRDHLPENMWANTRTAAIKRRLEEVRRGASEGPRAPKIIRGNSFNFDVASGGAGLYSFSASVPDAAVASNACGVVDDDYPEDDEEDAERAEEVPRRSVSDPDCIVWPTHREDWEWEANPSPSPTGSPPQDAEVSAGPRPNLLLAEEVRRVLACAPSNYRGILDLSQSEWGDLQAINSRYRRLMRLLHPDKRKDVDVIGAGGKQRCDEAVERVQAALTAAKKAAQADPRFAAQRAMATSQQEAARQQARRAQQPQEPAVSQRERLLRMQELKIQQCRQAMERQRGYDQGAQGAAAAPAAASSNGVSDVGALLESLARLSSPPPAAPGQEPAREAAASPQASGSSSTTAEILGLLAGLRPQ
eukprot:TRINITY_DN38065_c0_g1_i1.p1 TRINITY_DN38065_c0_g1~~TRINITY_DN38065_c0_g1_i1.p1  ORF type:complete len:452 (-),score=94.65 TRINITY_DN38065_c0_g1_i1:24-1241(-)